MSVRVKTTFDLAGQDRISQSLVPPGISRKSKDLHTEDGATVFATMEEARPRLLEMEREEAAGARVLERQQRMTAL